MTLWLWHLMILYPNTRNRTMGTWLIRGNINKCVTIPSASIHLGREFLRGYAKCLGRGGGPLPKRTLISYVHSLLICAHNSLYNAPLSLHTAPMYNSIFAMLPYREQEPADKPGASSQHSRANEESHMLEISDTGTL